MVMKTVLEERPLQPVPAVRLMGTGPEAGTSVLLMRAEELEALGVVAGRDTPLKLICEPPEPSGQKLAPVRVSVKLLGVPAVR